MTSTGNNTGGASGRTSRFRFLPPVSWAIMTLIVSGGCVNDMDTDNRGVVAGDRLPVFSVIMSDGSECGTSTLKGKWGVIEFFNTGCEDCRENFPVLQEIYDYYLDNENVEVIAIAREEGKDEIESYWKDHGLTVPWSPQPDRSVYNLFATVGIPRMYISNPEGMIKAAYGPEDPPTATQVKGVISEE